MYVVELDRPWIGSGFAFQGFPITSQHQIEELRACCRSVFVDPERETWTPETRSNAQPLHGSTVYGDAVPVEAELGPAREIYHTCEHALDRLLTTIRSEADIDAQTLASAMSGVVGSIQRSPGAVLLLNAVRRKGSFELARALDTSILMVAFGRFLQYPASRLEVLGLAGSLLDVGMTMLPHHLVHAGDSEDAVDDGLLESHVLHSVELIRSARGLPRRVDEVVIEHHERQDGEGYPYGLSRDQITADGAIAAIVDSFSRLTSLRANGRQISASRALSLLHKQRGSALHEALTEQFIQCIGVYPVGSGVELNTGETGLVIAQNPVRRLSPRIMVMRDAAGSPINPHRILDLMKEPRTPTDEPYRIQRALPRDQVHTGGDELLAFGS
jgi:HD-GYP domain-containing protein (c-di-GMP phosphodiesterase class II)